MAAGEMLLPSGLPPAVHRIVQGMKKDSKMIVIKNYSLLHV